MIRGQDEKWYQTYWFRVSVVLLIEIEFWYMGYQLIAAIMESYL